MTPTITRIIRFGLPLALLSQAVCAQQDDEQKQLQKQYEKKISSDWFTKGGWSDDYAAVRGRAKKEGKIIFAYFTRSYARCPPCISLEDGALSSPQFSALGKKAILFCHVTTQIEGRADDDLLSQKGFRGFPTLAILDAEGEILTQDVGRTVSEMNRAVDSVQAWHSLKSKVDAGAKDLAPKLFIAELRLGKISPEDAKTRRSEFKFSAEDNAALDTLIFDGEVSSWLKAAQAGQMNAPEFFAKIYKAYKAGSRPSSGSEPEDIFWTFLVNGAEEALDAEAFEVAAKHAVEKSKKDFADRLAAIRAKAAGKKD